MGEKIGKVWLVGAGPSDVGLFTIKGKHVLENADVVVYDKLVGQAVLNLIPKTTRMIDVGKRASDHPVPQHEINQILLNEALGGNLVVRLKGGDPFLFGRGGEELELLCEHNIPFEIIPGVTSAISVPAYAGIPVTHRDFCSSLHIITGHTKSAQHAEIDYKSLVSLNGTLIFLMGVGALADICLGLLNAGMDKDMPAAILEKGTTAKQRRVVSTLEGLVEDSNKAQIKTPAIIIVGKVCSLADKFSWAEKRPLGGLRIVVTRPQELASTLTQKLTDGGAEVVELPSIVTQIVKQNDKLKAALQNSSQYSFIVLTSPTGVKLFFDSLREYGLDIRSLIGIKFAAIGFATAKAIEEKGIKVDLIPAEYNAISLGKELCAKAEKDKKILIARAASGTPELINLLDEQGLRYDDIAIYETVFVTDHMNNVKEYIENGEVDYVAFTSGSTVKGFVESVKDVDYSMIKAICIGEQTASEANKYNMQTFVAKKATIDSMVELLTELNS